MKSIQRKAINGRKGFRFKNQIDMLKKIESSERLEKNIMEEKKKKSGIMKFHGRLE